MHAALHHVTPSRLFVLHIKGILVQLFATADPPEQSAIQSVFPVLVNACNVAVVPSANVKLDIAEWAWQETPAWMLGGYSFNAADHTSSHFRLAFSSLHLHSTIQFQGCFYGRHVRSHSMHLSCNSLSVQSLLVAVSSTVTQYSHAP